MRDRIALQITRLEQRLRTLLLLSLVSSLLFTAAAGAQPHQGPGDTLTAEDRIFVSQIVSGLWRSGGDQDRLAWSLSGRAFERRTKQLHRRGFELIDIESESARDGRLYSGLWRRQQATSHVFLGLSRTRLRRISRRQSASHFQLIDIESWVTKSGRRRYDAIFAPSRGQHQLELGVRRAELRQRHAQLSGRGLRMLDLETWLEPGGERRWSAIWQPAGGRQQVVFDLDQTTFDSRLEDACKSGLMLEDIEVYYDKNSSTPRFAAIWRQLDGEYWLLAETSRSKLLKRREEIERKRNPLHLIDFEVRRIETSGSINQPPPAHDAGSAVPPPPDNSGG